MATKQIIVPEFLTQARPAELWRQDSSIVQSKVHLEEMLHALVNAPKFERTGQRVVANDTETNGLSFVNPEHNLVGLSFSAGDNDWYVPLRHNTPEPQLPAEKVLQIVNEAIFKNKDLLLVGHNWKFDRNKYLQEGYDGLEWRFKEQALFDTQIMFWLLDENQKDDDAFYLIRPGQMAQKMGYKISNEVKAQWGRIPVLDHFTIPAVQQLDGFSLKALSNKFLGMPMMEFFDEVVKKYKIPYRDIAMHIGGNYAKLDTRGTIGLFNLGAERLWAEGLDKVFYKVEVPFIKVLGNMERRGIPVSQQKLSELRGICEEGMDKSMKELYDMVGYEFNINSGKQVGKVFEDLGLGALIERTDKGNAKTDEDTINLLAKKTGNPGLKKIVEFKKFKKMLGTYIDGDSGLASCVDIDGRVHPSLLHTGTVTGRLAVIAPPAQTWPANPIVKYPLDTPTILEMKEAGVDLEKQFPWAVAFDEDTGEAYMAVHLRDCITELETRPGYRLLVADYSQMELRVLCHFAKDEGMRQGFLEGKDIHKHNASIVNKVAYEDVTKGQRKDAKAVSFGLAYGKTVKGFAEDYYITEPDFITGQGKYGPQINKKYLKAAQKIIDDFFGGLPDVAKWINSVHKYVETYGFVKTITGRKRRLPFIWDAQMGVQNRARRQAVNTKIQGSSADLIKMAMIKLEDELEGTDIEMLMQIHDELIFAVPDDDEKIAQAMEMVQRNMENVVELFLPMVAEPSIAWRYGSAK